MGIGGRGWMEPGGEGRGPKPNLSKGPQIPRIVSFLLLSAVCWVFQYYLLPACSELSRITVGCLADIKHHSPRTRTVSDVLFLTLVLLYFYTHYANGVGVNYHRVISSTRTPTNRIPTAIPIFSRSSS